MNMSEENLADSYRVSPRKSLDLQLQWNQLDRIKVAC